MAVRGEETPAPDYRNAPDPGWRAAWPFFVAIGVVVVVIAIIVGIHVVSPASDRMSDKARVQTAVSDYFTAKNAVNYDGVRDHTCAANTSASNFPPQQTFDETTNSSRKEHGTINIVGFPEITVDGDNARVSIEWNYTKNPKNVTQQLTVKKENDAWRLCGQIAP